MIDIKQVMIFTTDLESSLKFYNNILGITVKQDLSEELSMLIMESNSVIFTIHFDHETSQDNSEHSRTCIAFAVDDIEKMLEKLKQENVEFLGPMTQVHCEAEGHALSALQFGGAVPEAGGTVYLRVRPGAYHVFPGAVE